MNLEPNIRLLAETRLIGKRVNMSFASNRTKELWQDFMPKQAEIKNKVSSDLYSIEIYHNTEFFKEFNPVKEFEKWAAMEVSDFDSIPNEMETIILSKGMYAVFQYIGKASEASRTYQYIFDTWIPNSEYALDDRPHFALMGEKYKNEDPNSEEELWIPIKRK